jgi:drug/metabolite transporter (DMT)-like permease
MKLRDIFDLVTLGILWGAGYLFIRVVVPEFGTFALMEVRMALAAAMLLPLVFLRRQLPEILAHWKDIALMGLLHYAIPFSLYAWALQTLSAGYASVINASAPLFAAVVARIWISERLDTSRTAGLVCGFAGVALLVWDKLSVDGAQHGVAVAATVVAALCYGFAAVMAKRRLAGVSPMVVAGGSMSAAALGLLPLSIALWPETMPSVSAFGLATALGVLCTALAFVLYFRLIASAGPSKAITVTFLIPLFAVVFGAVFLGEHVTPVMVVGGGVIAIGTALATGLIEAGPMLRRVQAFAVRTAVVIIIMNGLDDTPADVHAAEPEWSATSDWSVVSVDGHAAPAIVTRLHRSSANRKIGLEYAAFGNAPADGVVRLGFYREVDDGVSVKFLVGAELDDGHYRAARIEFSWPFGS